MTGTEICPVRTPLSQGHFQERIHKNSITPNYEKWSPSKTKTLFYSFLLLYKMHYTNMPKRNIFFLITLLIGPMYSAQVFIDSTNPLETQIRLQFGPGTRLIYKHV